MFAHGRVDVGIDPYGFYPTYCVPVSLPLEGKVPSVCEADEVVAERKRDDVGIALYESYPTRFCDGRGELCSPAGG